MQLYRAYQAVDPDKSKKITSELMVWLRDFFAHRVNSRWADERRCIPPYIVMEFARKGILGFNIDEAYGGLGLQCQDWIKLIEQLGALDATISQLVGINALAIRPLVANGSDEMKATYLPVLAKGEMLGAFAQTEQEAGTHFTEMQTSSVYNAAKQTWTISGNKFWIGNAGWAGLMVIVCRALNDTGKTIGLNCFLVSGDSPGLEIGEELNTLGLRGVVQNKLHFDNLEVNASMLIGQEGKGVAVAVDAMSMTRVVIAAQQLGLMKKAVLLMHSFMEKRTISTGLLIDNPLAINILSECIARIMVTECLLKKIAVCLDNDQPVSLSITALCKVIATEFAGYVIDKSLQFLGGRGYEENNLLPQMLRDTRVTRIFEGPSEALLSFVGTRIKMDGGQYEFSALFDQDVVNNNLGLIRQNIETEKSYATAIDLDDLQRTRWVDYKVGLIAAWGLLKLVTDEDTHTSEAISQWLDNGYEDMPKFITGYCFLSSDAIAETIQTFKADIGEVHQSIPGLNWAIDPLIGSKTPNQHGAAS